MDFHNQNETTFRPTNSRDRLITYNEETLNIGQWAKKIGINVKCLRNRLDKFGWSIEDAIKKPPKRTVVIK